MAYLPKNQYKVLYTNGTKYRLEATGEPYTGEYIKTTEGRLFAGKNPSDIKGRLVPIIKELKSFNILTNHPNNILYQLLDEERATIQDSYIPIPSSKPLPLVEDYNNGFFNRYISVRLNTQKYIEISKDVYTNFNERPYNKSLNKVFFVKWYLTNDSETQNINYLNSLEENLPGIFNFFPNKKEYEARNGIISLTPSTRGYINGDIVDKNLPAAYQLGNKNPNTIENENVPKNQYCGNCKFHQKGNCSRWEAKVKHEFWCKAYKAKLYDSFNNEVTEEIPLIDRKRRFSNIIARTPSNSRSQSSNSSRNSSNRRRGSY